MVFEEILKAEWMHKNLLGIYLLALLYSAVAVMCAAIVFPNSIDLISVAFIGIIFLPSLEQILSFEARTAFKHRAIKIRDVLMQHASIFWIYLAIMLGIFSVFLIISLLLPTTVTSGLFKSQLAIYGNAGTGTVDFNSIAQNNLRVIFVTFFLSMIYGAGSILMISWNASVWGAIIGFFIKEGIEKGGNPLYYLTNVLMPMLPHLIFESGGYLLGAIGGGLLAISVVNEKIMSKRFKWMLTDSLAIFTLGIVLIIFAAWIEVIMPIG
jgi:uncharacterized membrane protein SpoIIM required for sporulation